MSKDKGNGHKTLTPDVSHIRNVEVTHETSDINVNGVLTFVVALVIMTVGVYFAMLLLFNYFNSLEKKSPPPGPMALKNDERLPPEPRLQTSRGFNLTLEDGKTVDLELKKPAAEYEALLAEWNKDLRDGSKDQSGQVVSIPIDEAIKKVVAEGLPAQTKNASGKLSDFAVSVPTAASSGRMTEKRTQ